MKAKEVQKRKFRRYYLHKKVKVFTTINTPERMVNVSDGVLEGLKPKQWQYLKELQGMGYSLQQSIV